MDYKKMYFVLFGASAKAIELLTEAHKEAEKIYMETDDTPIELVPPSNED